MIKSHSSSVGIGTGQLVLPQDSTKTSNSPCRSDVLINLKGSPSKIGDGSQDDCIESLHRLVGPCDGRSRPGPKEAATLPGRGASNTRAAQIWHGVRVVSDWLDDSLIGAAIGVLCLFGFLIMGLFLIHGAGVN